MNASMIKASNMEIPMRIKFVFDRMDLSENITIVRQLNIHPNTESVIMSEPCRSVDHN